MEEQNDTSDKFRKSMNIESYLHSRIFKHTLLCLFMLMLNRNYRWFFLHKCLKFKNLFRFLFNLSKCKNNLSKCYCIVSAGFVKRKTHHKHITSLPKRMLLANTIFMHFMFKIRSHGFNMFLIHIDKRENMR